MADRRADVISKRNGAPPKQAPPWKIALPFAVFCAVVLAQYFLSGNSLALIAAFMAAVMGAVWTYGAWTVCRDEKVMMRGGTAAVPGAGDASVISRARLCGFFKPAGHLLATDKALLWIPRRGGVRNGDVIAIASLEKPVTVAAFVDIVRFRAEAGIFGGDKVTLSLNCGICRFRLLDPEGLGNLLAVIPEGKDVSEL